MDFKKDVENAYKHIKEQMSKLENFIKTHSNLNGKDLDFLQSIQKDYWQQMQGYKGLETYLNNQKAEK